jgi:hypothetical protein
MYLTYPTDNPARLVSLFLLIDEKIILKTTQGVKLDFVLQSNPTQFFMSHLEMTYRKCFEPGMVAYA